MTNITLNGGNSFQLDNAWNIGRQENIQYTSSTSTTADTVGYIRAFGTGGTAYTPEPRGIESIAETTKKTRKVYYNKIREFPRFEEVMAKFNELRMKHSHLSKMPKKGNWNRIRTTNVSKEMQSIVGALNIYNNSIKGFANRK